MPKPQNSIVKYSSGQYEFKVPFIMYADFESLLVPIEGAKNNPNISSTRRITEHVPSGWCVYSVSEYAKVKNPIRQYRGKDCVKEFCEHIISEAKSFYKSNPEKPMYPLTKEEQSAYNHCKICHICKEGFKDTKRKVRDHCHFTRKYRGAAHSSCNIMYKVPNYIPVVFHNLAGYDSHLFIKELSQYTDNIKVIAKNSENYISFSIRVEVDDNEKSNYMYLRFIDSAKFMNSSLDSLVNNLNSGGHKFFGMHGYDKEQRGLLVTKGIYPYEFMDDWSKFENTGLPEREKFYSNLNMSGVSEKDYEHAINVWEKFNINNMGEYHDLYLKTDTILLANVFESFRKVCIKTYGLDHAHFCTHSSWVSLESLFKEN